MKRFPSSRLPSLLVLSLAAGCGGSGDPPVASPGGASGGNTGSSTSDSGDTGDGDGDFDIPDAPCDDPPGFTMERRILGGGQWTAGEFPTSDCFADVVFNDLSTWCGEFSYAGTAMGDYDGDGLVDLAMSNTTGPFGLFRNLGDMQFEEVAVQVGISPAIRAGGSSWVDIDKDGDLDLYISSWNDFRHYLYLNEGGSFTEVAVSRNATLQQTVALGTATPAIGDPDLDGWPDIFLSAWRPHSAVGEEPTPNALFINRGASEPGFFDDQSTAWGLDEAGISPIMFMGVGGLTYRNVSAAFIDTNGDDWPELSLVGDAQSSEIYENQAGAGYVDVTDERGFGQDSAGMGLTWADFDLDGDMDAYVTSICEFVAPACFNDQNTILGNRLYDAQPGGFFERKEAELRVRCGAWGWGTVGADFDNDGDPDLALTNGFKPEPPNNAPYTEDPEKLWINHGGDVPMQNCSDEVGFNDTGQGRGLNVADLDNDGDLDMVVAMNAEPPVIYVNQGGNELGHWLRVSAVGQSSLKTGRGARLAVRAESSSPWMLREIGVGSHYLGHDELIAHFGLGASTSAAELRVCWPATRRMQVLTSLDADQQIELDEANADIQLEEPCAVALLAP